MEAFDETKKDPYNVKELMFYFKQHDQKAHVRLGLLLMEGIANKDATAKTLYTLINKMFVHSRDNVNFKDPKKAKAYWYDVAARVRAERKNAYRRSLWAKKKREESVARQAVYRKAKEK